MTDLIFEDEDEMIRVGQAINRLISENIAFIDAHEDEMEPGHYSLRVWTSSRYLSPEVIGPLGSHGFGLEYLGEHDEKPVHVWLLDGMTPDSALELTGHFVFDGEDE